MAHAFTTAEYRTLALQAEAALRWEDAAYAWEAAISVYPTRGALADLDKAKMQKRAEAARESA